MGPGYHPHLRAGRVHGGDLGREQQVHAAPGGGGAVGLQIARVASQVLGGTELERIDEEAHHHPVGPAASLVHQGEMPLVQGAHGGDQGDPLAGGAPPADPVAQLRNRRHQPEGVLRDAAHSKLCSGPG